MYYVVEKRLFGFILFQMKTVCTNLHAIYVDPCPHSEFLSDQSEFGDTVQQPVVELQRDTRQVIVKRQTVRRIPFESLCYLAQIPHQYEVSVLRGPVLGRQFEDVSLLNELISRVHDVLFSPEQLVHLQQLPHALLRDTNHSTKGMQARETQYNDN